MIRIFIALVVLAIVLDFETNKVYDLGNRTTEEKIKIISIVSLHHLVNIFANFGWLFSNRYVLMVYVLSSIMILLYWYLNDNLCGLSVAVNDITGQPKRTYFNDFFNIIGLKKIPKWNTIHVVYIIICNAVAIYKIYRSY